MTNAQFHVCDQTDIFDRDHVARMSPDLARDCLAQRMKQAARYRTEAVTLRAATIRYRRR